MNNVQIFPKKSKVWYSQRCTYWTTNWVDKLHTRSNHYVCPRCKSEGFVLSEEEWEAAIEDSGYPKLLRFVKEKCFGQGLTLADLVSASVVIDEMNQQEDSS